MRQKTNTPKGILPFLTVAAVLFFPGCREGFTGIKPREEHFPRPIYDLVVEPSNPVLELGEAVQFEAYWKHSETGALHRIESVAWVSDAPKRVIISADGLAEAHRMGEVTITAISLDYDDQGAPLAKEGTAIVLVQ